MTNARDFVSATSVSAATLQLQTQRSLTHPSQNDVTNSPCLVKSWTFFLFESATATWPWGQTATSIGHRNSPSADPREPMLRIPCPCAVNTCTLKDTTSQTRTSTQPSREDTARPVGERRQQGCPSVPLHERRKAPCWSNTWILLLPWSEIKTSPVGDTSIPRRPQNCPGPVPTPPNVCMSPWSPLPYT